MAAQSRQNYSTQVDAALDGLINMHLQAAQTYISLGFYFVRDPVAQEEVSRFFQELAQKKYESAHRLLMRYCRGKRTLSHYGKKVPQEEWSTNVQAMEAAVALESSLNQALSDLHALACANSDSRLCDFLVSHFLQEEMRTIQKLGIFLTTLRRLAGKEADLSDSFNKLSLNRK